MEIRHLTRRRRVRFSRVAPEIPVIDVRALSARDFDGDEAETLARAIDDACRDSGFFYVVGHEVEPALLTDLDSLARQFFDLPATEKARIEMARAGRAWRGWFPVGAELTS